MKQRWFSTILALCLVLLFLGALNGCGDDDDDDNKNFVLSNSINTSDPSKGFIMNSLNYSMVIDIDEKEEFKMSLSPGMVVELELQEKATHLLHVVVVNDEGRVVYDFVNSFYIDEVPLDNQFKDFLCSWFVELTHESGFGNNFGS